MAGQSNFANSSTLYFDFWWYIMAIFLVQHGQAASAEKDLQRPLTALGIKESSHVASVAEYYMVIVDEIVHSDKLRARQTAEIFATKLKPARGLREDTSLSPEGNVEQFAATLKQGENTLVVGHLPFLQRLLSLLITGNTAYEIMKFQNSGIICLEPASESGRWQIKWTLSRHIS